MLSSVELKVVSEVYSKKRNEIGPMYDPCGILKPTEIAANKSY